MIDSQAIAKHNTLAVQLMKQGRNDLAIQSIKRALHCLDNNEMDTTRQNSASLMVDASQHQARPDSKVCAVPEAIVFSARQAIHSVSLMTAEAVLSYSPDNLFTLYPRAFEIDKNCLNFLNESKILVILRYNMAVFSHVGILANPELRRDPVANRQLLEQYRNALEVVCQSWSQQDADDMIWLILALACNVGHVHCHILNFGETRESLSLLLYLIALSSAREHVPYEDFRIFFGNISIFLYGLDLCIAPAA